MVVISWLDRRGASVAHYPRSETELRQRLIRLSHQHLLAEVRQDGRRVGAVQVDPAAKKLNQMTWWFEKDLYPSETREAARLQPYCLCCQREIAQGELCSDCERELETFLEYTPSATLLDVSAEFDLTIDETQLVLQSVRDRLRQRVQLLSAADDYNERDAAAWSWREQMARREAGEPMMAHMDIWPSEE